MKLEVLSQLFCVCRLESNSNIPNWLFQSYFYTITKTNDELSLVCEQKLVPLGIKAERDFVVLKVLGPLDFSLTGILSSIAKPLSEGGISIFAISSFDTDYILVRKFDIKATLEILNKNRFTIIQPNQIEKT